MIQEIVEKIKRGVEISKKEAINLADTSNKSELHRAAGSLREYFMGNYFDTCSIVNARSGRCSENCKWCAQSTIFKTKVQEYDLIAKEDCMKLARLNKQYGVNRFSFVTSGRALSNRSIDEICNYALSIKEEMDIHLCASMGLLNKEQLARLKSSGINRYHCNLESSEKFFPTLCSSHTINDKIETIKYAQELGMDVCSGGIIGMGETMEDRIDLAFSLKKLGIQSIPINILNPIPGTALEGALPLSDEEILTSIAVFRFINPDAFLRLAGGRLLIAHLEEEAFNTGINAVIVGDMLTTEGPKVREDMNKIKSMGFSIEESE